ncbi:MAG: RNA polymerase sigma factor [Planctomycetales bacterium]
MSQEEPGPIPELLRRAREGDQAAVEQLFQSCRNYLGVVARAQVETWLQAKVDASDVVQQTLLEAHRGFGKFEGGTEKEWLAWLRRILQNNAADFVRHWRCTEKRQVNREISLESPKANDSSSPRIDPADGEESPSQQVIRQERELQMADALTRLPADYQEVIMLRNLQRLPFDQVAARMERSRPAVQMLWTRAIRKLREEMGDEED